MSQVIDPEMFLAQVSQAAGGVASVNPPLPTAAPVAPVAPVAPPAAPPVAPVAPPAAPPVAPPAAPPVAPVAPVAPPAPESAPKRRGRRTREEIALEDGFILYLNCAPIKGIKFENADERIKRCSELVTSYLQVAHWSLSEQGRGSFLATLQKDLQDNPQIIPVSLTVLSGDNQEALACYMAGAKEIIRGY
jgi:hypothetical protein